MIVDDHSLIRRVVAAELRKLGAENIDEAADGSAAIEKIRTAAKEGEPYGIVFLDWTMPGTNGLDVLAICKAHNALQGTAVVMLSSESEEENVLKALEAGATAYITKPFKPEQLLQKLKDVMDWQEKNAAGEHG